MSEYIVSTAATSDVDTKWMNGFLQPEDWTKDALCQEGDPDAFFPDKNDPGRSTTEAKKLCLSCDVRLQCLEYAMRGAGEKWGVWGGLSETERRRLKKREAAA